MFLTLQRRGFYLSVFLFGIRVALCSCCTSSIDMKWGRHFHTSSRVTADPSRTAHYYKRSSERAEMKSQPRGTCLSNKLNQRLSPSVGQLPSESRGLCKASRATHSSCVRSRSADSDSMCVFVCVFRCTTAVAPESSLLKVPRFNTAPPTCSHHHHPKMRL